jgi:hypothetical protein
MFAGFPPDRETAGVLFKQAAQALKHRLKLCWHGYFFRLISLAVIALCFCNSISHLIFRLVKQFLPRGSATVIQTTWIPAKP